MMVFLISERRTIMSSNVDNDIDIFCFELFILIYADKMIICESSNRLQHALNMYNDYYINGN